MALLVAASALPAAAAARRAPQNFYGVSWDNSLNYRPQVDQERQWDLMASSGVESVRALFSWAVAQPSPHGQFDFSITDRLVARAAKRRIQLLPVVFEAPAWAQLNRGRRNSPPRRPRDYAAYLRALVSRYGPRGSFWSIRPDLPRRPVRAWQIWNEPDLKFYWNVRRGRAAAWPKGYVKLLKAARKAIKSRDRGADVVLAGISEEPWTQVRRLYRLKARRLFDVVAIHPYNADVRTALTAVRLVRGVMRGGHDSRKPIWVTELGWPAARGRVQKGLLGGLKRLVTTDNGMAKRVAGAYNSFLDKSRTRHYGIGRLYWFTWATSYLPGEAGIWDFAGLVMTNPVGFVPTPALAAYKRSARRNEAR
ncbi:MAG TPA: beta-galactosidase [Thermoleophilaceae bacterium]